ncbi:MAG: cation:proton antiporter [Planctomycetes bacterium]|nr:cation:proton antiporter [Planctomycetota bacterium]
MDSIRDPAIFLSLALAAAVVGGFAANLLRVPRVVGYLAGGLALRWVLNALLTESDVGGAARDVLLEASTAVQGVKTLALGLILFVLGSVFEVKHLRSVGPRLLHISLAEMGCTFVLVTVGATLAWLLTSTLAAPLILSAGLLLGIMAMATAPAATVLVVQQYDARGAMSDSILTMTAGNNLVCIVLFHAAVLVLTWSGVLSTPGAGGHVLWLDLLYTSVGSVALGTVVGFVLSVLYAKLPLAEFFLVFITVLLGIGACERSLFAHLHISFNFLVTSLFIGAAFANLAVDQERLHSNLSLLGKPVYACFFVLAGYELHVTDLRTLGALGAVYVVLRTVGKSLGGYLGARWIHVPADVRNYVGLGLLCQAGVAIGLVDFLVGHWGTQVSGQLVPHPLAAQLKTIVLGSVVVFELFGPLVLKSVLVRSGEVKALTLLRRPFAASSRAGSALRLTWEAALRTLLPQGARSAREQGELCVRHIMRTNVRLLAASARLDEVLHFVERSRDQQFPVVDEDQHLVGMVHCADLREIIYDPVLRDLVTADDLARQDEPAVPRNMLLTTLFEVFQKADVGTLPVVAHDGSRQVIGLVEQRDLLRVLHEHNKQTGNANKTT